LPVSPITYLPGQALILPPETCIHFSRGMKECQRLLQKVAGIKLQTCIKIPGKSYCINILIDR
jgi:hypothetical protein